MSATSKFSLESKRFHRDFRFSCANFQGKLNELNPLSLDETSKFIYHLYRAANISLTASHFFHTRPLFSTFMVHDNVCTGFENSSVSEIWGSNEKMAREGKH